MTFDDQVVFQLRMKYFRVNLRSRFSLFNIELSEDLVRYALNMLGDHAKPISSEEELDKFTVSDPEYMFVGESVIVNIIFLTLHATFCVMQKVKMIKL